jgi:alpha-L-rhamnosidase
MRLLQHYFFIIFFGFQTIVLAESIHWTANWISHPSSDLNAYGVYHFRKNLSISDKPEQFIINISADNKYKLYVNGMYVNTGPAYGDYNNWFYDRIDIASYLKVGENTIAAVVWNFSEHKGWNQISARTAFVLQCSNPEFKNLNTDNTWKVIKNSAYHPQLLPVGELIAFIVTGCTDSIITADYPVNWESNDYDDSKWVSAKILERASAKGQGSGTQWNLTLAKIPFMEERIERIPIIRASNVEVSADFLKGKSVIIPANSYYHIILDNQKLTNAYTVLKVKDGKNSKIDIKYAEALFYDNWHKGNRDDIKNKQVKGIKDVYVLDGREHTLQTLFYRTYRYIELTIKTTDVPLVIDDFYGIFTAYPFKENAIFKTNDTTLHHIWNIGWHTARLCAVDTYMDCPYYERMQYVGDTRIQALISLYVSGDNRLMKHAIELYNSSRFEYGLTYSRYPTSIPQVIPPFSLFWVSMLYDYYKHNQDFDYVKPFLSGVDDILTWYESKIDKNTGLLSATPYWNFVDWTNEWPWNNDLMIGGVPDGGTTGNSTITTLQFAYTLEQAIKLYSAFNQQCIAKKYIKLAQQIKQAAFQNCWDNQKQLLADTPEKKVFSQHANIWGILTNTIPIKQQANVMNKILSDTSLIQTSYYFKFYLFEALRKTGQTSLYLAQLDTWKDAINLGLTTFPETPEPTRSDCHAWSSSPNYHFLSLVCGITPLDAGFKSVQITPSLGNLKNIDASMPHYLGNIELKINSESNAVQVNLPIGLTGKLNWNNKTFRLKEGENVFK